MVGPNDYGGEAPSSLRSGGRVKTVRATYCAFTALKEDGSIISWGTKNYGGTTPGNSVTMNFTQVFSRYSAFCGIQAGDSSIISWGDEINSDVAVPSVTGVVDVASNRPSEPGQP